MKQNRTTPKSSLSKPRTRPTSLQPGALRLSWVERMESLSHLRWHPLLMAFLANTLLFGLTYLLFNPQFNTRDDTAMMLLAAGKVIALQPTEYLVFTNILLGHVLKALYSTFPNTAWYALYLILSLFAAHVALLYVILNRRSNAFMLAWYALYFVIVAAYMLVQLQFTMVASMVGIAAIALLLFGQSASGSMDEKENGKQDWKTVLRDSLRIGRLCGIALALLSAMIRWDAFLSVLACSAALLVGAVMMRTSRSAFWQALPAFVLAVGLGAGAQAYHRSVYAQWGTMDYIKFNAEFGKFTDFKHIQRITLPSQAVAEELFKRHGWSLCDYELMLNDAYLNEALYNIEKFRRVQDEFSAYEQRCLADPELRQVAEEFNATQRTRFWGRELITLTSPSALNVAVLLIVGIVLVGSSRKNLLLIGLFIVGLVGVVSYVNYLTFMRDAPERVTYPLFAYLSLLPLFLADTRTKKAPSLWQRVALPRTFLIAISGIFCLAYAVPSALASYSGVSQEVSRADKYLHQALDRLQPDALRQPENLYVIWANGFPMGSVAPFGSLAIFENFHAVWLMWAQRTPTTAQMLAHYGIKDLYWDIAANERIFVLLSLNQLMGKDMRYAAKYARYMEEHFHQPVQMRGNNGFLLTNVEVPNPDPYTTFLRVKFDFIPKSASDSTVTTVPSGR